MERFWCKTCFVTTDISNIECWVEALVHENVMFDMSAYKMDGNTVLYVFLTHANTYVANMLVDKYGFTGMSPVTDESVVAKIS